MIQLVESCDQQGANIAGQEEIADTPYLIPPLFAEFNQILVMHVADELFYKIWIPLRALHHASYQLYCRHTTQQNLDLTRNPLYCQPFQVNPGVHQIIAQRTAALKSQVRNDRDGI